MWLGTVRNVPKMGKAGCTGQQTQNNSVAASETKAEGEEEEKIMREKWY